MTDTINILMYWQNMKDTMNVTTLDPIAHYMTKANQSFTCYLVPISRYLNNGQTPRMDIDIDSVCALMMDIVPDIFNHDILDRHVILEDIRTKFHLLQ